MSWVAEVSIKNNVVTWVVTLAILLGGISAFNNLGRLEDPVFTIKEALVVTSYPGATPEQVSSEVSNKLEIALQQMPQVDYVKSTNAFGVSIITVTIKDKFNLKTLPQVWDELRRKVADTQKDLPVGVTPSLVNDSFGDVYGMLLSVTAEGYSYAELKEVVDNIRRELVLVPNVGKIVIWGEQEEAIYIEVSRAKIAQLGVGPDTILNTLQQQNKIIPAGAIKVGRDYVRINPTGSIVNLEDIKNLDILDSVSGRLFRLSDVAVITRGYREPTEKLLRHNGRQALAIGISNVPGTSVVDLGEAINSRLAELESTIPIGFELNYINYQPDDVAKSINSFLISFVEAVIIVFVVLLAFMGLRSGLLIGVILILTILATFVVMNIFDINLQRISLGALIIALGMLVDNAIVITEGILIRIQRGEHRLQAAKSVVAQNLLPLLGATVIAIMAFAAIGASKNTAGEFTSSLFYVMLISLFMSWVIAVTITPMLCHEFLLASPTHKDNNKDPYDGLLFLIYRKILVVCLKFKLLSVLSMLMILLTALYGFMQLKGSFFPASTRAQFMIHYYLPEGSDIRATSADIESIEAHLVDDERIASVSSFIGKPAPRFMLTFTPETMPTKSYGMILVELKDSAIITETIIELDAYLAVNFPDAEPKIKRFVIGPPIYSGIEVRFSGPDPVVLRGLSEQAKAIYRESGIATYIRDDWRNKVKEIRPQYSETNARLVGVSKPDFNSALAVATEGLLSGYLREGDKLIPIVARYPESERLDAENLADLQVFSSVTRQSVPILQIAPETSTEWANALVQKRNRKLTITTSAEPITGELPSDVMALIQENVEAISIPVGYSMEWGGEYESSRDAQAAIASNMPLVLLLMLFILTLLFNSIRLPLVIFLTVPFTLIGVSLGLILADLSFSFMAMLGFLSLVGMVIKNGIVLVDQIVLDLEEKYTPYDAIIHASLSRMRPVMMAAITTVLGMIPLVTDGFFGAMAVTIMGGLSFATLLTLIAVPVFYAVAFNVNTSRNDSA